MYIRDALQVAKRVKTYGLRKIGKIRKISKPHKNYNLAASPPPK